jgi:hypothetical protein
LRQLDYKVGFVACDDALAAGLMAAGEVQDPRIGRQLRRIEMALDKEHEAAVGDYSTKEMKPRKRGRPAKS